LKTLKLHLTITECITKCNYEQGTLISFINLKQIVAWAIMKYSVSPQIGLFFDEK